MTRSKDYGRLRIFHAGWLRATRSRYHVTSNMCPYPDFPPYVPVPAKLGELILRAAEKMARHSRRAFQIDRRPASGQTLRPGKDTPLWNELRAQLRPYLRKYGHQANLARLLGLPRQRVNEFVTGGGQMPDAERTLQLLAWVMAVQHGTRPA